jgi:hypothetical protein
MHFCYRGFGPISPHPSRQTRLLLATHREEILREVAIIVLLANANERKMAELL